MSPRKGIENRLLAALPKNEYKRLHPALKPVRFPGGHVLCEAREKLRYVYFPSGGMAALHAVGKEGYAFIGTVGNEGFIGDSIISGVLQTTCRVVVQFPLEEVRVPAAPLLAEFKRQGKLWELLLGYKSVRFTQIVQAAVCNRFHSVSQRLCRVLLATGECLHSDSLTLTHESIAKVLANSRGSIGQAAKDLQKRGLIAYHRGDLRILDRKGLERGSCECHRIIGDCRKRALGLD